MTMSATYALALLACLLQAARCQPTLSQLARPHLQFSSHGQQPPSFRVVLHTDLHYGESEEADAANDSLQANLLAWETPQLLVLGGDQVTGKEAGGGVERHWRRAVLPADAAGVPHAAILGNHDDEGDLSRRAILRLDAATSNLSLTQQGPVGITGASNYWLDVADPATGSPAARLWFLDSMSRGCGGLHYTSGCVGADTVAWLARTAQGLPPVAAQVAFVHVPLPEVVAAWDAAETSGGRGGAVCCPLRNTGLLAAARAVGIEMFWHGHDHNNDFSGIVDGVRMGYGRKTGYGGYGPGPRVLRGARVIELTLGAPAEAGRTWIRQEDGSIEVQAASDSEAKKSKVQHCCLPAPRVSDLVDLLRVEVLAPLAAGGLLVAGLAVWRRRRRPAGMQALPTSEPLGGSSARGGFIVGA